MTLLYIKLNDLIIMSGTATKLGAIRDIALICHENDLLSKDEMADLMESIAEKVRNAN